ncbi:MAG: tRNA 2-thiouridine(34) synthase MnmA [Bacteroidales bacterium]|nr:tRNA 2-thiouridine(34) synthase MnmA [Bacteroidales bacterium]
MMKGKVLMAMSGGIDSSVSAMLLQEQGYELIGATYRTWDSMKESCLVKEKGCCTIDSIMEAKHLAERLGFEHHILDLREDFHDLVIRNFIDEYLHGRTPNPCVVCNPFIKWGKLLEMARSLGCDYIATGHYAKIVSHSNHFYLQHAKDNTKDQTYFLWLLQEEMLKRTLFPLADFTKEEVRRMAAERGFEQLSKKSESQEICFVPDDDYRRFLAENVTDYDKVCRPGDFIDTSGKVLGQHQGFTNYTIGQRKGLRIAMGVPMYVCGIDAEKNTVMLGHRDELYTSSLESSNYRFTNESELRESPEVMAQIRYRSAPTKAKIEFLEGKIRVLFDEPVWGVTPGQSVVFFKDNRLVGGGFIS